MNDVGGDNVGRHLAALDADHKHTNKEGIPRPNDTAHLEPSRWFFAKSVFPMAAGTLGPVASAFSICALVRPWRQIVPPGQDITQAYFIEDPSWLTVVNAIQLAVAIVANMFLLLNMARRIRFAIAQPVTIVGWYLSSVLLIVLEATAAGPLQQLDEPGMIWSGAFYFGMFAAILYFLVASLMLVTFMGALSGRYSKDFDLTTSQRTLMLQTIMVLLYLLLGALVFSKTEGWAYLDAVYWADVTLLTVGFGDYAVSSTLGRALLFPYALIGIISLGLVIGSIRTLALERTERKLTARIVERKRRQTLRRMTKRGDDEILRPISEDRDLQRIRSDPSSTTGLAEYDRRQEEFRLMRKIQDQAERRRRWVAMGVSASTWATLWVVAAAVFQSCESPYQNWSYFDAVYFCFVSLTTIGYGDVTPISPCGKAFFVFWSLLALPTSTVLVSNAGDTIVKAIRVSTNQIGNITILPGERGFKRDVKGVLRWLSCGKVFDEDDIEEDVPGFLGATARRRDEDDDGDNQEDRRRDGGGQSDAIGLEQFASDGEGDEEASKNSTKPDTDRKYTPSPSPSDYPNPTPPANTTLKFQKARTIPSSSRDRDFPGLSLGKRTVSLPRTEFPRTDFPRAVSTNKAEYHRTLINEIQSVTQHLKSKPPRKYTFQEWAWYLQLIGEDESSAETHRMAQPHIHKKMRAKDSRKSEETDGWKGPRKTPMEAETKAEDAKEAALGEAGLRWSWVGTRSPLMSSQEEAGWILEKLTRRLQEELSDACREQDSGQGKGKGKGRGEHGLIEEE